MALIHSDDRRDAAQQLSINASAARGEPRAVRKQIRDLTRE